MEASLGADVDLSPQELLHVELKADEVQQAATLLHIDQQVEVALRVLIAAGEGAEETNLTPWRPAS